MTTRHAVPGWLLFAVVMTLSGMVRGADRGVAPAERNVALGAKYTLWPSPNYALCTDPDDKIQLTDGKTTRLYFWTQKGTVGWQNAQYVVITLDLQRVQPIGGVAFDTAAGRAGVRWPATIDILVSDDGKDYYHAGELVTLDHQVHGPWPNGYAIRRLSTTALRTKGRFVRFLVVPPAGGQYIFCDEVEVFSGAPDLLSAAHQGEPIADVRPFFQQRKTQRMVAARCQGDVAWLAAVIREAKLPGAATAPLQARLDQVRAQLERQTPPSGDSFRAILPFGPAHAQVFQIQADLWKAQGCAPVCAWAPPRWDPVPRFAAPPQEPGNIAVHALRGEFRAAAVNLANCTPQPLEVRLTLDGSTGAVSPLERCVTWHAVPWTLTSQGDAVAAALPEIPHTAQGRSVVLQPGLTQQIWLTFHPTDIEPGPYACRLIVSQAGPERTKLAEVPLSVRIYTPEFPHQPDLLVGGWCYTDSKGDRGVTRANRQAFVKHLQERFVNCPWATGSAMLRFKFDRRDPGQITLETADFDDWVALWPDAAQYRVFLSAGSSIGGVKAGTPDFEHRVATWISAWVRHLATRGIAPQRLALLIHDEPHEKTDVAPIVAWARAIHAAAPRVVLWLDPTYSDPGHAPAELFETATVLCPNRPMWLDGGAEFAQFYRDQQQAGRVLEFYSCSGPVRALDPYSYYLLQAWHCWQVGAVGSSFWSFSDNAGVSCWNEQLVAGGPFSPLFLDATSVTAGKQMEAVRESVEDYQTFVMLRQAVERARAAGRSAAAIKDAEYLLRTAAGEVLTAADADKILWKHPKDRTRADTVRASLLDALESLAH